MRTKIFLVVSLSLILSFSYEVNSTLAGESVKIACLAEFTGKYASYGTPVLLATRFNVEEKNAAGGIKSLGGAKIELVEADCVSDPKTAVAEAERLASDPKLLACIGPVLSITTPAVEPIHGKYGLPAIYPVAGSDDVFEHGNPYVFSCAVLGSRIGAGYAGFMQWLNKKYKVPISRISIAYPDNDYGLTVASYFKKELKKAGLEKNLVGDFPFDWMSKDLSPLVLKLKAAKTDFHVIVGYFADGKLFHDACYGVDFHPWLLGGVGSFCHPNLWKALGEKIAEATIGNPKTFGGDLMALDIPNPNLDAWLKRFKAKHPTVPVEFSLLMGAQASLIMIDAIEKGGRDRNAIKNALHAMKTEKNDPRILISNWEMSGPMFTSEGKPNSYPVGVQWDKVGGEWKLNTLWTPNMGATGVVPRPFRK